MATKPNAQTYTATKAEVHIGDTVVYGYSVEGLQGYRHSLRQIAACVGEHSSTVDRILHQFSMPQNAKICRLKVLHSNCSFDAANLNSLTTLLTTEDACFVFAQLAAKGNTKALAIVVALMVTTLTQRFDAAFGVHRSAADYQALTDAAYASLRDKFRRNYIPKFRSHLELEWKKLEQIPAGIRCQSHWQAHQVYALKRAIGLPEKTDVDGYDMQQLLCYEQALLDYDCFRRAKATHQQALGLLKKTTYVSG